MAKTRGARDRRPRKRAVLVGINRYPSVPLKGCVNDAIMVGKMLVDHFGFTPGGEMRLLVDERATKQQILDRLRWLVDGARAGDTLVFHYSGHGAQVPDRSGDEVDGVDECLCPIDHDWDHPLTDDDLAQIITSVPSEANFTVILDCCHSGTGTRALPAAMDPRRPQTVKRLVPPPDIQFRAVQDIDVMPGVEYFSVAMKEFRDLAIRRFGATVAQNAILIAGCRPEQLSKDAFLEGDYHGALTYSLYNALGRVGPGISHAAWIAEATKLLKGYRITDQDPQLECPDEMAQWRLFSTETATHRVARPPSVGNEYVVYVHGICEHRAGYSDSWWRAMEPYVPSVPGTNRREVLWSNLVTPAARALAQPVAGQSDVAEAIKEILEDRAQRECAQCPGRAVDPEDLNAEATPRAFLGIPGLDCIDDFVKYLLNRALRHQVMSRFLEVVRPLLINGKSAHVISHSWGAVVAYEALRLLDSDQNVPNDSVPNFFTVGSALSIPAVKRLLLPEAIDGRRPRAVARWINLDAKHDVVGGPMKGIPFEVDFEFLGLKPVSCRGPFVNPACAHASYFRPENYSVNRDIFGRYIEGPS